MPTFELDIPRKKQGDVADRLTEEGFDVDMRAAEGRRCILDVLGGVKDVRATVESVLSEFDIPLESEERGSSY